MFAKQYRVYQNVYWKLSISSLSNSHKADTFEFKNNALHFLCVQWWLIHITGDRDIFQHNLSHIARYSSLAKSSHYQYLQIRLLIYMRREFKPEFVGEKSISRCLFCGHKGLKPMRHIYPHPVAGLLPDNKAVSYLHSNR